MNEQLQFDQLADGDRIEMLHHWNTQNYFWQAGTVHVVRDGTKYFNPEKVGHSVLILAHRMDEVRPLQSA